MRKFWGFYKNESYSVGCNGGTVYIYNSTGTELAKFRDFPYAYTAAFKPNSNVIAVKSTDGFLGFYDLDSLTLIKKITVTRAGAQDEGFAFTPDGRYFYNIEKPVNSCQTQLSIYDAVSFEGGYIPFDWKKDFTEEYLDNIKFYCLVMSENYIKNYFDNIKKYASALENRIDDDWCTMESVLEDNVQFLELAKKHNANYVLIDDKYEINIDL